MFFSSSRSSVNFSSIFSILFPKSRIIFTIITLDSFSGWLPTSTSLSCFSGILSYSSIWVIILFFLIINTYLWMWFFFWGCGILTTSIYLLVDEAKRLMQAFWWEGLPMRKTRSCPMGSAVLSKTLILEGSHQGVPPRTTATSAPIPVVSYCHSILQGIFPTQGLNLGLLLCKWILDHLATSEAWWGY